MGGGYNGGGGGGYNGGGGDDGYQGNQNYEASNNYESNNVRPPAAIFLTIAAGDKGISSSGHSNNDNYSNQGGSGVSSSVSFSSSNNYGSDNSGPTSYSSSLNSGYSSSSDGYSNADKSDYQGSGSSPFSKSYATNEIKIPKSEQSVNQQPHYEPLNSPVNYESSNNNYDSKAANHPAIIYSAPDPYIGKSSSSSGSSSGQPEFRIAIIAADTTGGGSDRSVAESQVKESKIVPLEKAIAVATLALPTRK